MEYYSAIKNNGFMKFLDKWMYLEDIILSEVTQSQKKSLDVHSLISGYLFVLCEYIVSVFSRRNQIPLQMVVSHHVVAEN
jgi:hypothetical protein